MIDKELKEKLDELKKEEYVWFIYVGIIILSFYSNNLERSYYLTGNNMSKEKYKSIIILIFSVLLIVYSYFVKSSYDDIKKLSKYDTLKKKDLTYLSFIASTFILISGVIFWYIAIIDDNLDIELAFN